MDRSDRATVTFRESSSESASLTSKNVVCSITEEWIFDDLIIDSSRADACSWGNLWDHD